MKHRSMAVGLVAALACFLIALAGCSGAGQQGQAGASNASDHKISVVCTTFPAYDWALQVIGDEADRFDVTYLLDNGSDLHSFQPSIAQMADVSSCDLFVYVGGESDGWAKDALATAQNPHIRSIAMLEAVGDAAVKEEVVEGMQAEAEAEEEDEYDEHVWLSLRNAKTIVAAMATEFSAIDPEHADAYGANAQAYAKKLDELDARYASAVEAAKTKTLVFADRFPFRYLVDDYHLSYYAAFAGCSAETEASFETVAFLAKKIDELGLDSVLVIENSDQRIARTVIDNTASKDQTVLTLDSLQSTRAADIEAGKSYLSTMEGNLDVLVKALA